MEHRPPQPASIESESKDGQPEDVIEDGQVSSSPARTEPAESKEKPPLPNGDAPPLPDEAPPLPNEAPPLPEEAPPTEEADDGWAPLWDDRAQAFYFYNRFTQVSQWENPRVPTSNEPGPPSVADHDRDSNASPAPIVGYNPAIHGDYDPNADYAKPQQPAALGTESVAAPGVIPNPEDAYAATGAFNRFTGKWQSADFTPERFGDEAKSKRQMNAFFDVDAAANSHDGRSLRAERQQKKLSKAELKAFKEKRRDKKEEKRRAWLKD